MANMAVLAGNGVDYTVVVHVAIPVANNVAGTPWRTALVNSGLGRPSILPAGDGTLGTISAADVALIASGALYEYVTTIRVGTVQAAQQVAYVTAQFPVISATVLAALELQLQYFGFQI
jgi:hypothetical protein